MNYVHPIHQAAGHDGYFTAEDNSVFIKATTPQEIQFYQQVQEFDSPNEDDSESSYSGSKLIDWLPIFMGTLSESAITERQIDQIYHVDIDEAASKIPDYIVLQNLYHGFSKPSILDIKLGSLLTDPETTTPEKIERLRKVSESTTSGSLNLRICGMKVYTGQNANSYPVEEIFPNMLDTSIDKHTVDKDSYITFNKVYGRSLDVNNIAQGILLYFKLYFGNHPHGKRIIFNLLTTFLRRFELLYNCLLEYPIRIYSGSLLFIYESDLTKWTEDVIYDTETYETADPMINESLVDEYGQDEDDIEELGDFATTHGIIEKFVPLSSLHIIDFAHAKFVDEELSYDENFIIGIENLIKIFKSLIEQYK
ncbi:hypothetical protein DFJ63DRAFT_336332 [Scheffersomyces coipomensis]|uniref:uncharacterized protein n=1 Tax=Scheffersomyces coipomensis TaxID=1788519 RepID=UPI00315D661E